MEPEDIQNEAAPLPSRVGGKKKTLLTPKTLIIGVGAAVVIAAVVLIVFSSTGKLDLGVGIGHNGLAARVNGAPITTRQLDALLAREKLMYPQIFGKNSEGEIRSQLLKELINEQLILQEAQKQGVMVTDKEVDAQVEALRKQYGSEAQFNDVLKKQNYTLDSLRVQQKYQLAAQGIVKKLVPDDSITTQDVKAYFEKNKQDYTVAAGKRVSQIKFALGDTKKAADVLAQIQDGGDFAKLAQKNSIDAKSAASGGDIGWTPIANPPLDATLQAAVNGLEKGEVTGVIKSSTGLFVLKVTDTRAGSQKSFDEVKPLVKATLLNSKRNTEARNLLEDLRKKAKITIYDKVVKEHQAK
jgi:parvulin-like peptidyl-prolyl isomerase